MTTVRRSFLGLCILCILSITGPTADAHTAKGPLSAAAHGHVLLQIDGRMISSTLTPAQAISEGRQFVTFSPHLPPRIPAGMALQGVSIDTFGGSPMFASVSLDFAGPRQKSFTLRESKLHLTINLGGGTTTTVKVGKVAGRLTELKRAGTHKYALSWFSVLGYDLHTVGATTGLTSQDLLAVARGL